jgi:Terminase large subunit, T4likevirus-type, N-terminal
MLARDLAHSLDPVLLAADVGLPSLDPWQTTLLRSMRPGAKIQMLCSRQSGKTTVARLMCLHTMLYSPGSTILLGAPSQEHSNELLLGIRHMHGALDGAPELRGDAVKRIECSNNSRIIALSGEPKNARGKAAHLVVVDEAAEVDPELWPAIRPTLATTSGSLAILGTPKGKNNKFAELWNDSDPGWTKVRVDVNQCPRISDEFKASELKELGPALYGQEYLLDFLEDSAAAFNFDLINAAFDPEVRPLWH